MLDINALMVIAVAGALVIGEWEEAAVVVFLFSVAQWLESQSIDRARAAIRTLLDLAPIEARIEDHGIERLVPLDRVLPGQMMHVRPGERFALDGTVRDGRSDVNQAPITGESVPVEKAPGDEVFAGTINGHGALVVAVTRRRDDTTLARIIHLVEQAQAERAPVQQFIDRFAAWYTPAVVAIALAVGAVPILAGGDVNTWVYRALVVLVVACPCALVISTPVSMVSALAGAARHGVLIKGGAAIERLAGISTVAFDKTGTLTRGEVTVGTTDPSPGIAESALLAAAASVEQQSEHPIAQAIVLEARTRGLEFARATDVRALPGLGVQGRVDGVTVLCAAPRYFRDTQTLDEALGARVLHMTASGMSPVIVHPRWTGAGPDWRRRPRARLGARHGRRPAAARHRARRHAHGRQLVERAGGRRSGRGGRGARRAACPPTRSRRSARCAARAASRWSVTASTTRRPWPPPTSASSWARWAATPPSRPRTSR